MFRFTIQAGLLLAIIFAAASGVYGGYAATQVSPPKGFLLFAVVCGTMSGAIGFPLGAVLAALGYAAFHWLRAHPMRYKLRTLLILLALGPPMLALGWWGWQEWRARQASREFDALVPLILQQIKPNSSGP